MAPDSLGREGITPKEGAILSWGVLEEAGMFPEGRNLPSNFVLKTE